jgi:hypothetical protein
MSLKEEIEKANNTALKKVLSAQPFLTDFDIARRVIPNFKENMILHAGPPITWDRISGPQKGAIIGAIIYEGLADAPDEAELIGKRGEIELKPCHDHSSVGPMAGAISASMPVMIVENKNEGLKTYSNLNEGIGEHLRYGAFKPKVIEKLKWMETTLFPALKEALNETEGIDLNQIIARALHMNDECHNRNVAATCLLQRSLFMKMIESNIDRTTLGEVLKFVSGNDHFFLNFSMAACKSAMDTIKKIENSTIVTAMTRNGTDFGIRVSGLGNDWFTSPSPTVQGLYFPGYNRENACPDIGDSSITETRGLGGFAMAASPSIVQFVGGTVKEAMNNTLEMYEITTVKDTKFTIPQLGFQGVPVGIDIRKVVELNVPPVINTGIAHKMPGIGQIGAGIVRAPMECFQKSLIKLSETMGL